MGMTTDMVVCPQHGQQSIGLVCTHIAHAIDSGERVVFFWADDTDTARPDAWCACLRKRTPCGADRGIDRGVVQQV